MGSPPIAVILSAWRERQLLVVGGVVLAAVALVIGVVTARSVFPIGGSKVFPPVVVGGLLDVTKIPDGEHTFTVRAVAGDGSAGEGRVTVRVDRPGEAALPELPPIPPSLVGGDDAAPFFAEGLDPALGPTLRPLGLVVTREAEDSPQLHGDVRFSGVIDDGSRRVLVLSQPRARALYYVQLHPHPRYLLEVRVRHDAPAPVDAVVYVNGKAWKRVIFAEGDAVYRTHRVGILRNFPGGVIGIRFLNDVYDAAATAPCGTDAACLDRGDRNLYLDWLRFVAI